MTKSMPSHETNADLLRKIIEAQVKGGCDIYKWHIDSDELYISPIGHSVYALGKGKIYPDGTANSMQSDILRILFDTVACKAAYPGNFCEDCNGQCPDEYCPLSSPYYEEVMHGVIDAWNHGEGDNIRAALIMAVTFLPNI